jgi:hypothetical protein
MQNSNSTISGNESEIQNAYRSVYLTLKNLALNFRIMNTTSNGEALSGIIRLSGEDEAIIEVYKSLELQRSTLFKSDRFRENGNILNKGWARFSGDGSNFIFERALNRDQKFATQTIELKASGEARTLIATNSMGVQFQLTMRPIKWLNNEAGLKASTANADKDFAKILSKVRDLKPVVYVDGKVYGTLNGRMYGNSMYSSQYHLIDISSKSVNLVFRNNFENIHYELGIYFDRPHYYSSLIENDGKILYRQYHRYLDGAPAIFDVEINQSEAQPTLRLSTIANKETEDLN